MAADWPELLGFRTARCIRCHGARARQAAQLGSTAPLVKPRSFPFWPGASQRYDVYLFGCCPVVGILPADLLRHGTWFLATRMTEAPAAYPCQAQSRGRPKTHGRQNLKLDVTSATKNRLPQETQSRHCLCFIRVKNKHENKGRKIQDIALSTGKQKGEKKGPVVIVATSVRRTTVEGERKHCTRQGVSLGKESPDPLAAVHPCRSMACKSSTSNGGTLPPCMASRCKEPGGRCPNAPNLRLLRPLFPNIRPHPHPHTPPLVPARNRPDLLCKHPSLTYRGPFPVSFSSPGIPAGP